jgi:hypothetical protein
MPDLSINIQSKTFAIFQCVTEFDIIKLLTAVEFPADDTFVSVRSSIEDSELIRNGGKIFTN